MFVVSVDSRGKIDPMVHVTDCFFYQNKEQGDGTIWYGPYPRFSEAWKICFLQAQSQRRIPQKHECIEDLR